MDNYQKSIDILLTNSTIKRKIDRIQQCDKDEYVDVFDEKILESSLGEDFIVIDNETKDLNELNASVHNAIKMQNGLAIYTDARHKTKSIMSAYCTAGTLCGMGKYLVGFIV